MAQPSVVFIDDSATMREVIKIAFRRENFEVFAFADPSAALQHVESKPPDVIITDVIMPGSDGYQVCEHIKHHPTLSSTPVILMSGVVNREVADKAFAVKAAELVRKPFQPQDLISRVKQLVRPKSQESVLEMPANASANSAAALSSIFAKPQSSPRPTTQSVAAATVAAPPIAEAPGAATPGPVSTAPAPMPQRPAAPAEFGSMKVEVLRLEGLVRKLQAELTAEREYSRALEEHVKTLQEVSCSRG